MNVTAVKTKKVLPSAQTIFELLDESIQELNEKSVVAITSKVISLCEGRVVPASEINKKDLLHQEADYYLEASANHGFSFSITNSTLIPMAGIDESNGDGNYILWPKDPQKTANEVRKYLTKRFNLKEIGVVVTDSTCTPMRWGTLGIALSYSGFAPTNNYIGKPDLFGRPFEVSQASIAGGLAAAAVLAMGEGTEQTPIAILQDLPFVEFQDHDPTPEELKFFSITSKDEDLFAPFLNSVKWHKGEKADNSSASSLD